MDFDLIKKAGLTIPEAADMVGISHVSMWQYVNRGVKPRKVYKGLPLQHRCRVFLHILDRLVANGSLPKKDLAFYPAMPHELRERRDQMLGRIKKLFDERVDNSLANT